MPSWSKLFSNLPIFFQGLQFKRVLSLSLIQVSQKIQEHAALLIRSNNILISSDSDHKLML